MAIKSFVFMVILLLIDQTLFGQHKAVKLDSKRICGWNKLFDPSDIWEFEVDTLDLARQYVKDICDVDVIDANFIVRRANVDNAIALIDDDNNRIIYYSEAYFQSLGNKWFKLAILAHEIGHHINNHTLAKNNVRTSDELTADRFAGKILCKLGAPFEIIRSLIENNCSTQGSDFYPPSSARLEAMLLGFEKGGCKNSDANANFSSPPIIPELTRNVSTASVRSLNFQLFKNITLGRAGQALTINYDGSLFSAVDYFTSVSDTTYIYSSKTGRIVKKFKGGNGSAAISNTKNTLVATSDCNSDSTKCYINIYNYQTGNRKYLFSLNHYWPNDIKFSPDDKLLVVGTPEGIHVFNLVTGREIDLIPISIGIFSNINFSQDSKYLAIPSDTTIYIYSTDLLRTIRTLPQTTSISTAVFIPYKREVAFTTRYADSSLPQIRIINIDNNTLVRSMDFIKDSHASMLEALAVSADGRYLAASGSSDNHNINIYTYEGKLVQAIKAHTGYVNRLAFTPDNKTLISAADGSWYNPIRIWKIK